MSDNSLNPQAAGAQGDNQFLPSAQNFDIPDSVYNDYPQLINLILQTESMNDEERQYWFQILPIMTADQIENFKEILVSERKQLQALDAEYEKELNRLNDKHMSEWKEFESQEKKKARIEAEKQEQVEAQQKEEDLLKQLEEI